MSSPSDERLDEIVRGTRPDDRELVRAGWRAGRLAALKSERYWWECNADYDDDDVAEQVQRLTAEIAKLEGHDDQG